MIYTIAEAGLNHNGRIDLALKLCDLAKEANWSVVKFQKRSPELSTPREMWDVKREWNGQVITYLDYRRQVEFWKPEYDAIAKHCEKIGLPWTASVWDEPSADFMSQYDVPFIKIPSAHLTNHVLLRKVAETGVPMVVSTGMSTENEIAEAVGHIPHVTGASLMHCTSTYPAPDDQANLSYIPVLGRLGFPVGYSSHHESPYPAIYSAFFGAQSIEAHVTLNRSLPGTDQPASLELKGMVLLKRELDRIEEVRGDGVKRVWDSELGPRKKLRGY